MNATESNPHEYREGHEDQGQYDPRYRGQVDDAQGMNQGDERSGIAGRYMATARNNAYVDEERTAGISGLFAFVSYFKTHIYLAVTLRTALILYGDHQVST